MASSSKPAVRGRVAGSFSVRERVRLADTDATGIIYFGAYARFVEIAETEFFRTLGIGFGDLRERAYFLPRVHVEYDFFAPAVLDDEIALHVAVAGVGVHSVRLTIDVERIADGATLAEATVVAACVGRDRKSAALPSDVAEKLRAQIAGS